MFNKIDENGEVIRRRTTIDCQSAVAAGEKTYVEQSHARETNLNEIVKKHGISRLALTQQASELVFDDVTTNDFQESMNLIIKGREIFNQLSSEERYEFKNSPEIYLDYVHNPANKDALIERGWMKAPPPPDQPIKVEIANPETPSA